MSQAVDAMIALHDVDAAQAELPPLTTYAQKRYDPPRWTTDPALWERAVELFHRPVPTSDVGFVHRDFNPGNVLWVRDRLSGLVDWQWACFGPRSIDPAHCRLNLFHYNQKMAEEVRIVWEQQSGLSFDPWADLDQHHRHPRQLPRTPRSQPRDVVNRSRPQERGQRSQLGLPALADPLHITGHSALVPRLNREQLIDMLDKDESAASSAAATDLRAGAEFTLSEGSTMSGQHFSVIYRRRRVRALKRSFDVRGLDHAIAGFERAAEVDGLVMIYGAERLHSVFLSPGPGSVLVACISTPAK